MRQVLEITDETTSEMLARCGIEDEPIARPAASNGHQRPASFDAVAFLNANGIRIARTMNDGQWGTKYLLAECPFDSSHKTPDSYVGVMPDGKISFKCSHNSCAGYRWQDLRRRFDPGAYDKPNHATAQVRADAERPVSYEWLTASELAAATYSLEYDIEDMHVVGQPQITAAEKKALKTNLSIDASISQASGLPFLGKFNITRKTRVAVMSGESGLATIQETAMRICKSKGIELNDLGSDWVLSSDVPQLDDPRHHEALAAALADKGIEQLYIDPTYLCIPGDDAGNLIKQGRLLRVVGHICQELGVSLTMLHHTKKSVDDPFRPAELADISWSGFAEWARQWWLLSRRVRYDADRPGHHELWFNVGGSAGHSSLWALNIDEGSPKDFAGRRWQVEVMSAKDARQEAAERQEHAKKDARQVKATAKVEAAKTAITDALRTIDGHAASISKIQERAGCKGAAFDEAFAYLLRAGKLVNCEITKANNQTYEGYRYVFDNQP